MNAVINGEIYDYDRLRLEMVEKCGYQFKGESDCELFACLVLALRNIICVVSSRRLCTMSL